MASTLDIPWSWSVCPSTGVGVRVGVQVGAVTHCDEGELNSSRNVFTIKMII